MYLLASNQGQVFSREQILDRIWGYDFFGDNRTIDTRAIGFIPDLSVVTQLTISYEQGQMDQRTYESILAGASKDRTSRYCVLHADATFLYAAENEMSDLLKHKILSSLEAVLKGQRISYKLTEHGGEPIVLVGLPIVKNNENIGGVFVLVDIKDLLERRQKFYKAILMAIVIVIPFLAGISYIYLRRIIKPIKNVVKVALSMIQGDFSVRADETLEGEIGLMGRTINKLSVEFYKNASQLYIEKSRLHQVLYSLEEGVIAIDENRKSPTLTMFFLGCSI